METIKQDNAPQETSVVNGITVQGTREGVLKAVQSSKIPDHWKAVIAAELGGFHESKNHFKLDAHITVGDRMNVHITVAASVIAM